MAPIPSSNPSPIFITIIESITVIYYYNVVHIHITNIIAALSTLLLQMNRLLVYIIFLFASNSWEAQQQRRYTITIYSIIDTITTRRKRKTITDFYTRITFSITIRSSSINSSNSDILLLLLQINNRGCLRPKILYGILCFIIDNQLI